VPEVVEVEVDGPVAVRDAQSSVHASAPWATTTTTAQG
jgi:hypothetical protein